VGAPTPSPLHSGEPECRIPRLCSGYVKCTDWYRYLDVLVVNRLSFSWVFRGAGGVVQTEWDFERRLEIRERLGLFQSRAKPAPHSAATAPQPHRDRKQDRGVCLRTETAPQPHRDRTATVNRTAECACVLKPHRNRPAQHRDRTATAVLTPPQPREGALRIARATRALAVSAPHPPSRVSRAPTANHHYTQTNRQPSLHPDQPPTIATPRPTANRR
jgi:hypothetical protein